MKIENTESMLEDAIKRENARNERKRQLVRHAISRSGGVSHAQLPGVMSADIDASDIIDVILRRKWFIAGMVTSCLVAAAVMLQFVSPEYTASAQVIIDSRQAQLSAFDAVLPGLGGDNQTVLSEVQVLQSRTLAGTIVDELDLDKDPEFNETLRPPSRLSRIAGLIGFGPKPVTAELQAARVVNTFLGQMSVEPVPNSRVISVSITSGSPDNAARIVNSLVDEYVLSQRETKYEATTEASSVLNDRIADLQKQLLASESEIERFRSAADLIEAGGSTIAARQMADLNAQLILARTATAEAAARLEQLTVLIDSPESGGIFTASEVLQSPLIQNLRQQQVTVNRRIAELSSEFGMSHPTMVQLRAEAADLDSQINIEVNKIAQGLRNELAIAQTRQRTLERELRDISETMSKRNEDEIHLRSLEREAEVNRQLLATLLARQKEVDSQDQLELQDADARVISYADVPTAPSYPQKGFMLGIVGLMASLLALVVVFVIELRQRGFLTNEQLEATTGIQSLGFVPRVSQREQKGTLLDLLVTTPRSPFAQALTTVNWQLAHVSLRTSQIFLVTSATTSEGKSTTAAALARTKALGGAKTLLIDGDIRKPTVHKSFDKPQSPGLIDVLEREHKAKDIIVYDSKSSLDILTAGKGSPDPLPLLDSPQMDALLKALRRHYDYIIIDTPPILAASDACALSKKADATLFVVRWSQTSKVIVQQALRQLERSGGHVAGTLLTMLDTKKYSSYGYGDYGGYGGYGSYGEENSSREKASEGAFGN